MQFSSKTRLLFCSTLLLFLTVGCSFWKSIFDNRPRPEVEAVYIQGGTFTMGDVFEQQNTDALPLHKVIVDDFIMTRYEITYQQYDIFADHSDFNRPKTDADTRGSQAVAYVTWPEAQAFCEYIGMRLPTEQEWEYAAREGGKKILFPGTNDPDSLDYFARHDGNSSLNRTLSVGIKKPNDLGLYDMAGNAYEWIGGFYQFYPKAGKEPKWDSMEPDGIRIIRGGSFASKPNPFSNSVEVMKTYWRVGTLADGKDSDIGFRCAASAS